MTKIIKSYHQEKTLWYDKDEGPKQYIVTVGVLQSPVLDTVLWNIVLVILAVLCRRIHFSDNLAVVIAEQPKDVGNGTITKRMAGGSLKLIT